MKKLFTFIPLVLWSLIPLVICFLFLCGQIIHLPICERFDGVLLEEFAELNKAKATKVVVHFRHNPENTISITDRGKIEAAFEFMKGRNNNWQTPCFAPVRDLVGISFIDKTGTEIAHYGFWSGYIIYYGYSKQENLPPVLILPVNDKEINALFEAMEVPVEIVNNSLGLVQVIHRKRLYDDKKVR